MDFDTNLAKGRQLLQLVFADDVSAGSMLTPPSPSAESAFLDFTALEYWGYSAEWFNYAPDIDLDHIQETLGIDKAHNKGIGHTHVNVRMHNGTYIPASWAKFNNIVNAPGGMFVAADNESPTALARLYHKKIPNIEVLPELKFWSDVAYLQWAEVNKENNELRYVVRHGITNATTISVIRQLLARDGLPDPRSGHMKWPDTVWRDEEAIAALLGTPNGSGITRLLIHHKRQLGHKIVKEVMLFGFSELRGSHEPSLVFKIEGAVMSEGDGTEVGVSEEQDFENQDQSEDQDHDQSEDENQDGDVQIKREADDEENEDVGFWIRLLDL